MITLGRLPVSRTDPVAASIQNQVNTVLRNAEQQLQMMENTINSLEEPDFSGINTNYSTMQNLPQINGVELKGDNTFAELGLVAMSKQQILDICK